MIGNTPLFFLCSVLCFDSSTEGSEGKLSRRRDNHPNFWTACRVSCPRVIIHVFWVLKRHGHVVGQVGHRRADRSRGWCHASREGIGVSLCRTAAKAKILDAKGRVPRSLERRPRGCYAHCAACQQDGHGFSRHLDRSRVPCWQVVRTKWTALPYRDVERRGGNLSVAQREGFASNRKGPFRHCPECSRSFGRRGARHSAEDGAIRASAAEDRGNCKTSALPACPSA